MYSQSNGGLSDPTIFHFIAPDHIIQKQYGYFKW